MFLIGVPLLIFPFAIFNILVFLFPGFSWGDELWHLRMISEGEWGLSAGDLLIALSILILLIELLKSARVSQRNVVDHVLSLVLFAGMLVEFLLVKQVASSVFFLLLIISFVDVVGGFIISIRLSQREVSVIEAKNVHTS
jgi:hypothetical protein